MLGSVLRQMRRRGGVVMSMVVAIVVAATGFTVLTASSDANRLQTVGTVQAHARTLYDILVRPVGSASALENAQGLVQPGFLDGQQGGIRIDQWRQILAVPGVVVAAPIAVVGTVVLPLKVPVDMAAALPAAGDGVARVDVTWSYDNGLSTEAQPPDFAYQTSQGLTFNEGGTAGSGTYRQVAGPGKAPSICPDVFIEKGSVSARPSTIECFSRTSGGRPSIDRWPSKGLVGQLESYPLPVVVAAVDPGQEDLLDGLDGAVTSGSSLLRAPLTDPRTTTASAVPILAASSGATGVTATVRVSRVVDPRAVARVQAGETPDALRSLPHTEVSQQTMSGQQAYRALLAELAHPRSNARVGYDDTIAGDLYWVATVGSPQVSGSTVTASTDTRYYGGHPGTNPYFVTGADDVQFRSVQESFKLASDPGFFPTAPTMVLRGTYDPARMAGLGDLTAQIVSGYSAATTIGADARSRQQLGGRALAPSPNIGGFVQPPPLMITTLAALPQLTEGWEPSAAGAPISAVRVRVGGVSGVDAVSREKVRLAAQRIQTATGLQVDVTLGSSAAAQTLTLPAGKFGRPVLKVKQYWLKKGVAVAIIKAADKKSLILFVLVLLVCALSVGISSVASIRSRRTEMGVLACLGWHRRHVFRYVITELVVIAVAAGAAATVLSVGLGYAFDTPVSVARALLAVPAALLVALLAGSVPAWLATRVPPLEAARPAVTLARRVRSPHSVLGLGLSNLSRTRARAVVSASGLVIAVAAFTLLLAISLGFQGAVVGTVLGDAVIVQARTADYVATAAILLLAGAGVANVLYINVRERGSEIATLRAVGWQEKHLTRMIAIEAFGIALIGALPGAAIGLAGAARLTGTLSTPVLIACALATVTGIIIAMLAATVPVIALRRLPTALLLTEN